MKLSNKKTSTIIIENNDYNSFEYIVALLCNSVPGMEESTAEGIASAVHEYGSAIVFSGKKQNVKK